MAAMRLNIGKIKQEMARLGWTYTKPASEMGISRQLLSYYLHKDIRGLKKIEKLAKPFRMDPKDLLV